MFELVACLPACIYINTSIIVLASLPNDMAPLAAAAEREGSKSQEVLSAGGVSLPHAVMKRIYQIECVCM